LFKTTFTEKACFLTFEEEFANKKPDDEAIRSLMNLINIECQDRNAKISEL
jgi:hypothetical protein